MHSVRESMGALFVRRSFPEEERRLAASTGNITLLQDHLELGEGSAGENDHTLPSRYWAGVQPKYSLKLW